MESLRELYINFKAVKLKMEAEALEEEATLLEYRSRSCGDFKTGSGSFEKQLSVKEKLIRREKMIGLTVE